MKRFVLCVMCVVFSLVICSCTQVSVCYADELKASKWHTVHTNGTEITLEFNEDNVAKISIKGDKDNTCTISGICVVNETSFVISDNTMAKNISIDYKLYGSRVDLTYAGSTITLEKAGQNSG